MSFDCKYKMTGNQCRRLGRECDPGVKGCTLYGKYVFPFKAAAEEDGAEDGPKRSTGSGNDRSEE